MLTEDILKGLMISSPKSVATLVKESPQYKAMVIKLQPIVDAERELASAQFGLEQIALLKSNGLFDVIGYGKVPFIVVSALAVSNLRLSGAGSSNNTKTHTEIDASVVSAQVIVKEITKSSDGKIYLYDSERSVGWSGLRDFTELLLQGETPENAIATLEQRFAGLKAKGDDLRAVAAREV